MIDHVVRRGIEHASATTVFKRAVEGSAEIQMPTWGLFALVGSFFVMVVSLSLFEYMLKDVVATLCMVETPSAAITISTPDEPASKDEKEGLLETAPTMTLVHQKPLTSSIRATVRHLVSQGGRLARFRGFRYHALWSFAFTMTATLIEGVVPTFLPFRLVIVPAIAGALTANLHAAWTHKVVSMPSTASLWQSIPSRSSWKQLALPAAVYAAMPYVSLYVAQGAVLLLRLDQISRHDARNFSGAEVTSVIVRFIAVIVIAVACSLLLCLPAVVTLVRVEASILPEDQDTIVPFDRSFDGKVVPKVLGGTGSIGFIDAWKSFNWEARRRLLGLYVKIFFIMTGLIIVAIHVWAIVGVVALGPNISKAIAHAKAQSY